MNFQESTTILNTWRRKKSLKTYWMHHTNTHTHTYIYVGICWKKYTCLVKDQDLKNRKSYYNHCCQKFALSSSG